MIRLIIFFIIIISIIGGLIFVNWHILKLIPKYIIISIVALFLALIILIGFTISSDDNKYYKGEYKPARFENGKLKNSKIE